MFSKIYKWLVYSSVNANQVSLTVNGFLLGIIPAVVFISGIYHVQLSSEALTTVVQAISSIIVVLGGLASAIVTIIGVVRKVVTSFAGTNQVIASFRGY